MRRGVSLLEVMFAILVVAIGLLAALTVFPVASAIAKKGQTADMVAVHGRSAIHDFDIRGMREPARWMAWNQVAGAYQPYAPVFGEAYCIDPRGIAANPTSQLAMSGFPYSASATQPKMRRLTLNSLGAPMSKPLADSIFVFKDDFTVTRPADSSLPAFGSVTGGARSTQGHFSWMATLAPRLELYDSAAAPLPPPPPTPPGQHPAPYYPFLPLQRGTDNRDYILSVVVFHDRPADMTAGDPLHERVIYADFADAGGTGYAGGEVYLTWDAPQTAANDVLAPDILKAHAGDWIMLCGFVQHNSGGEASMCRWYRVVEADRGPEYHAAENHYAIAASLSGPDWDMAAYGQSGVPGSPPIAVLMTGVVGVYEKTVTIAF